MMVTRPQTLGYGISDSPAGLAAFFYDKFTDWTYGGGDAEKALTRDEMLDDITLYWLTNTAASSAQLYWENNNFNAVEQNTADISIPVAVPVFPGEIYRAPKSSAERAYHKLIYFNEVDKGSHFAAWEQPELFESELRAAFTALVRKELHMSDTAMTKQILLTRRSPTYWRVTFNHPPLNIFGPETIPQLDEIIKALETDEQVKVVVCSTVPLTDLS